MTLSVRSDPGDRYKYDETESDHHVKGGSEMNLNLTIT